MAIKTFTSGEVLTASDTNTFLANAGLVFVKSQTIIGTPSSITVTDAFSSTYDNYVVQVTNTTASAGTFVSIAFGSTTSGYQWNLIYTNYATSAQTLNNNNDSALKYVAATVSGTKLNCSIPISGPNISGYTTVGPCSYADAGAAGTSNGFVNSTTQYTSFTISVGSGNLTGGVITVYGYRKA